MESSQPGGLLALRIKQGESWSPACGFELELGTFKPTLPKLFSSPTPRFPLLLRLRGQRPRSTVVLWSVRARRVNFGGVEDRQREGIPVVPTHRITLLHFTSFFFCTIAKNTFSCGRSQHSVHRGSHISLRTLCDILVGSHEVAIAVETLKTFSEPSHTLDVFNVELTVPTYRGFLARYRRICRIPR
jgi:hypothetical protein